MILVIFVSFSAAFGGWTGCFMVNCDDTTSTIKIRVKDKRGEYALREEYHRFVRCVELHS